MGNKHWKTIYKEILKPTELVNTDGNSMIISGSYSRDEAFEKIHNELMSGYGETFNLSHEAQLRVALLRRPNPDDGYEDMNSNYYAEVINAVEMPKVGNYAWFWMYGDKLATKQEE